MQYCPHIEFTPFVHTLRSHLAPGKTVSDWTGTDQASTLIFKKEVTFKKGQFTGSMAQ